MAMSREQLQALSIARARRRQEEAEQSPGVLGTIDAAVRGVADAATFGFADEISAGMGAMTGIGGNFGDYNGNLEAQRSRDEGDANNNSAARLTGQITGAVATPMGLAGRGITLMGKEAGLLANSTRAATEGALYGAASGAGNSTEGNRLEGAAYGAGTGALLGGAAPSVVAAGSAALRPVTDAVKNSFGPASSQAVNRVFSQLRGTGMDDAAITARLDQLGPDAFLVDAMGARGQGLARSAANVSPDARNVLETASSARQAGANERVVSSLESAAGLPQGSRLTVDGLKDAAYQKSAPAINAAYAEARDLGFDLPLEDFQEIIGSPMGRAAFAKASKSVQNRMAAGDDGAASNLGLLDQMKRGLDAKAKVASRAGDDDVAGQAKGLAAALRKQTDELLDAPEYANARGLRQAAYQTDEAFDLGAELAGTRVALDAPGRARGGAGTQGPVRPEVAQGYAAQLAEEILNRRGTPGALDRLSAPMQREAMGTALQGAAADVEAQLARERTFAGTHRALTGNSTTARQLAEMGVTAGAGAGLGYMSGLDIQQAGMAGVAAALLRKGGGAAVAKLRAGNEEEVAKRIADILIARGIPTSPSGVAIAIKNPEKAQAIARLLTGVSGQEAGVSQAR